MKMVKLNENSEIPVLGFGTWQLHGDSCVRSVEYALGVGYRHIDTAESYDNQVEVGRAIRNSGVRRDDIFLTSKVWMTNLKKDQVVNACKKSLDEIDTEYLDLYLIHWPNRSVPIEETLEAMNELKESGLIRAIGVSNFTINHLKDALRSGVELNNNQVEFHPSLNQVELKEFCDENGVVVTAYSPIAQGKDLRIKVVKDLSNKYGKSGAQVILNWLRQKNIVAIPRSSNPIHIKDNFESLDWDLDQEDVREIDDIDRKRIRIVNPLFGDFNY